MDDKPQLIARDLKRKLSFHEEMLDYNWDDGLRRPFEVIRNILCDLGTALLIYWSAQPVFYKQFESAEKVPDYEMETYKLVAEIEKKVAAGFYKTTLMHYDPSEDQKINMKDPDTQKIPPAMLKKVEGQYFKD